MYKEGKYTTAYPLKDGKFTIPQRTLKVIVDVSGKEERDTIEFISDTTERDGAPNPDGEIIRKTYSRQNMLDLQRSTRYTMKQSSTGDPFKMYYIDTRDSNFFFLIENEESPVTAKETTQLDKVLEWHRQKCDLEEKIIKEIF